MVGISNPGEVLYKAMLWFISTAALALITQIWKLSDSVDTIKLQVVELKGKTDGAPEKVDALRAELAALRIEVATNRLRVERMEKAP